MQPDVTRTWSVRGQTLTLGSFPRLMGIVNVTPDSFSDGGRFFDHEAAVRQGLDLVSQGAFVLDVGGESTRPDALPVDLDEELRRVLPVIRALARQTTALISIDTTKAEVARQALAAGAHIVNDISGLTFDPQMIGVCAGSDCGVICMHIQGTPQTMQIAPHYEDVVAEVLAFLSQRLEALEQGGVARERVMLDPGIGFGKTADHNLTLLAAVATLRSLGRPILIGHSRKRFLKKILQQSLDERLFGTVGIAIAVAEQHADLIRIHDVAAVHDTLLAWQAVRERA